VAACIAAAGVQGWRWYSAKQSEEASALFTGLSQAVRAQDLPKAKDATAQLEDKYARTGYARALHWCSRRCCSTAAMPRARAPQLTWVIDKSDETDLKEIARYRLAEVLVNDKAYDEALKVLDAKHGAPYAGLYADLRGDALALAGRAAEARAAYVDALAKLDAKSTYKQYVQVKLDALGGADAPAPRPRAFREVLRRRRRPPQRRRPPHPRRNEHECRRAVPRHSPPGGSGAQRRSGGGYRSHARRRARGAHRGVGLRHDAELLDLRLPSGPARVLVALALELEEAGAAAGDQADGDSVRQLVGLGRQGRSGLRAHRHQRRDLCGVDRRSIVRSRSANRPARCGASPPARRSRRRRRGCRHHRRRAPDKGEVLAFDADGKAKWTVRVATE
jgi:predicted negative regulator of RcsB-dependent stress response